MAEVKDIYEGLTQQQQDILYIIVNMLRWARTFYSEAGHLEAKDKGTLSKLGSIATAYRMCYRELRHTLHHDRCPDEMTYREIRDAQALLRKRGSSSGEVVKCVGMDMWVPVPIEKINDDINMLFNEFKNELVKKPEEEKS